MSTNITNLTLSKDILSKVASAGLEVSVVRHDSQDVAKPTTDRGVTLVGFHDLSTPFSDFTIDPVDKKGVRAAIEKHLIEQSLKASQVQVSLVYRTSKRSTDLSTSCIYDRNELVGFCYIIAADYQAKYPTIRAEAVEDFIDCKMQSAISLLTEWQFNNNYTVTFKRDDCVVFKSSTLQKVDWENYILYHASALDEQAV